MLYMKTRVTFRVAPELAEVLRQLPNQTNFVETALREALRAKCPACGGTGRVTTIGPRVSNFRKAALPRLERNAALQLKGVVRMARRVAATRVDLERAPGAGAMRFVVARGDEVLLRGELAGSHTSLQAN
jgi:hypothetical protein